MDCEVGAYAEHPLMSIQGRHLSAQTGVRPFFAFLNVESLHLRMQNKWQPWSEPKSTTPEWTSDYLGRHLSAQTGVCPFFAFLNVE